MAASPVGRLLVEAQAKALKKATRVHTSTADCGCRATVSFFTDRSCSNKIEPCSDHPIKTVATVKKP
jgi:hypothetical protein